MLIDRVFVLQCELVEALSWYRVASRTAMVEKMMVQGDWQDYEEQMQALADMVKNNIET